MREPASRLIHLLLTAVMAGASAGCAMNPVSGTPDLVFMSESSEVNIGSTNDAKIREKYGVYDNPELQAYVQQVGQKLATQSHRPSLEYHFTVLDSPEVNAFALPGGYIYITRGILAYLNSEAELAAVLGHEIGHVTARHGVRQHSAATATGMVGAIIGVATGIQVSQDLFNVLGNAMLSGYGREHELESDRLGAEYIARAGYDPQAMIRVIGVLKNQEEFEKKRAAAENRQPRIYHGVFASHPSSDRRLQEVVGQADRYKTLSVPHVGRENYLKQIESLSFGAVKKAGVIVDNRYYLPESDLSFDFPKEWSVQPALTSLTTVSMASNDQQARLQLDILVLDKNIVPDEFLKRHMQLNDIPKGESVKGLSQPSFTAILPMASGFSASETRVTVMNYNDRRLLLQGTTKTPEAFAAADRVFLALARKLRPLKAEERTAVERRGQGQRLRVTRAVSGDTFATLAKRSTLEKYSEETLRLINDKFPDGEPRAGEHIKIIE